MDQPPLPLRIVWFAPWTWKRRTWAIIAIELFAYQASWPLFLFSLWKLEVAFPGYHIMQ